MYFPKSDFPKILHSWNFTRIINFTELYEFLHEVEGSKTDWPIFLAKAIGSSVEFFLQRAQIAKNKSFLNFIVRCFWFATP